MRAAIALIFVFSSTSAFAETTWNVVQRFGLTGTWAAACNHPFTRSNFFETYYKDANGLVRRDVDRGAAIQIAISYVDSAEIVSPNVLKLRIRNSDPNWGSGNNLTFDVALLKEGDPLTNEPFRIRGLESRASDGGVTAKDGMLLKLGRPTYWQYKCQGAVSAL